MLLGIHGVLNSKFLLYVKVGALAEDNQRVVGVGINPPFAQQFSFASITPDYLKTFFFFSKILKLELSSVGEKQFGRGNL